MYLDFRKVIDFTNYTFMVNTNIKLCKKIFSNDFHIVLQKTLVVISNLITSWVIEVTIT